MFKSCAAAKFEKSFAPPFRKAVSALTKKMEELNPTLDRYQVVDENFRLEEMKRLHVDQDGLRLILLNWFSGLAGTVNQLLHLLKGSVFTTEHQVEGWMQVEEDTQVVCLLSAYGCRSALEKMSARLTSSKAPKGFADLTKVLDQLESQLEARLQFLDRIACKFFAQRVLDLPGVVSLVIRHRVEVKEERRWLTKTPRNYACIHYDRPYVDA